MAGDGLDIVWSRFEQGRTKPLSQRFNGSYRALVVETNDPLRMHRIRFKIPELHDYDLKPEECPWAVSDFSMGNRRSGSWHHPIIGDWVWIEFEKNHPYGPKWTGFATPTRRKFYPLPAIFGKTPSPVDEQANIQSAPNDYLPDYMPKDERPMSHGLVDRYGNMDISSSTGFFPKEHDIAPPPPDADNLTLQAFAQTTAKPIANNPDSKFMARVTKYGNMILQSDVGYIWKVSGNKGEFKGDFDIDEQWEINRWKYLQRVLHEDKPKEYDQRRMLMMTRYGHRMEMRDVGWFHTREGEFDVQKEIADGSRDERWIKTRTKGGHLIEQIDIGFDEQKDEFVKRLVLDEVAAPTPLDKEDKFGEDARQIRIVARTGRKIVIDDRKSNRTKAQNPGLKNSEIGIGILIKGRATPGAKCDYEDLSGDPRGYFFQMNEQPGKNHTTWGSPLGQVMEINDDNESIIIASRLPDLPMPCKFLEDNEFLEKTAQSFKPQGVSHHLLLDLQQEVVRLKSRSGHGQAPRCAANGAPYNGEFAGLEIHDAPSNDPWVELVDHDRRGLWFSHGQQLGIWRARDGVDMYQWFDEGTQLIAIRNGTGGKVQIFCGGDVEIKSNGNTSINAGGLINMKAGAGIHMQVGGARYRFGPDALDMNVDERCRFHYAYYPLIHDGDGAPPGTPSGSGASVSNISAVRVPTKEPSNRTS